MVWKYGLPQPKLPKNGVQPTLQTDIVGVTAQIRALEVWKEKNIGAYAGAAYMLAANILSTAVKLAPADTGYLRASRFERRPDVSGKTFRIEIGFGAPYALWVHERNLRYIRGEWKFLSSALDWHLPQAAREMASWCAKLAAEGKTIDDIPDLHPRIWTGGQRGGRNNVKDTKKMSKAQKARYLANKRKYAAWVASTKARDRAANVARIARESAAALAAQRKGQRAPRPGRG